MSSRALQAGFTLIELVVSIAISSVIVVFVGMFTLAPLEAFEAQSRRNVLVGDVSAAWPRMEQDLRTALPNSVRVSPNGNFVALEMLPVVGVTRYRLGAVVNSNSIDAAGTSARLISGQAANMPVPGVAFRLARNPDANVYAVGGSLTAPVDLTWNTNPLNGTGAIGVSIPPAFTSLDSPRRRLYLVGEPVTYLCNRAQGTLRRYTGYTLAANQGARDDPPGLAGATSNELIARGLTACDFAHSGFSGTQAQTVSVRLTAALGPEFVSVLRQSRSEFLP
jgi:MSHA biogenesis protein MshO